jgi:hypothetical protein
MGRVRKLRVAVAALVVSLVLSATAIPADAAPKWCEDDPIIVIGQSWAQIITKFDATYVSSVTGPLAYDVYVPDSAYAATFVYLPPSPVAKTVQVYPLPAEYWPDWQSEKVKLEVHLYVPATATFPTLSDVTGTMNKSLRIRGTSNALTIFHISLH